MNVCIYVSAKLRSFYPIIFFCFIFSPIILSFEEFAYLTTKLLNHLSSRRWLFLKIYSIQLHSLKKLPRKMCNISLSLSLRYVELYQCMYQPIKFGVFGHFLLLHFLPNHSLEELVHLTPKMLNHPSSGWWMFWKTYFIQLHSLRIFFIFF